MYRDPDRELAWAVLRRAALDLISPNPQVWEDAYECLIGDNAMSLLWWRIVDRDPMDGSIQELREWITERKGDIRGEG